MVGADSKANGADVESVDVVRELIGADGAAVRTAAAGAGPG